MWEYFYLDSLEVVYTVPAYNRIHAELASAH